MGAFAKYAACAAAVCVLGGCGMAEQIVTSATNTALTPVNAVSQQASYNLQAVNQSVSVLSASARSTSASLANSAQTAVASLPPPQPVAYADPTTAAIAASPPPTLTKDQQAAIEKAKNAPQPELAVLPKETLDALTKDQRGLQDAAQRSVLSSTIGEELFWDNEGRSGTAIAKDERKIGDTLCRSWIETVTIDGKKSEARATACKDGEKGHWILAF